MIISKTKFSKLPILIQIRLIEDTRITIVHNGVEVSRADLLALIK